SWVQIPPARLSLKRFRRSTFCLPAGVRQRGRNPLIVRYSTANGGFTAMSRRPNPVPTYRQHKPSGQAVITIRHTDGTRRDVYLGAFNSPESRAEYSRLVAELATATAAASVKPSGGAPTPTALTVAELLLAFWNHAQQHYRGPDGTPTSEIHNYRG